MRNNAPVTKTKHFYIRTIQICRAFIIRWNAKIVNIVNYFAPKPLQKYKQTHNIYRYNPNPSSYPTNLPPTQLPIIQPQFTTIVFPNSRVHHRTRASRLLNHHPNSQSFTGALDLSPTPKHPALTRSPTAPRLISHNVIPSVNTEGTPPCHSEECLVTCRRLRRISNRGAGIPPSFT